MFREGAAGTLRPPHYIIKPPHYSNHSLPLANCAAFSTVEDGSLLPQRASCCTFRSTPLPRLSLGHCISLCPSMLLVAAPASLSRRTFSGRPLCPCPCALQAGTNSQEQLSPVSDASQCRNAPASSTLKADNCEASVLHCFPKSVHRVKFQLPTVIAYLVLYFLLAALLSLNHFRHFCAGVPSAYLPNSNANSTESQA